MTSRRLLILAAFALLPVSCSVLTPMDAEHAQSAAKKSITVVNKHKGPHFTVVGTTIFSDVYEKIEEPGWAFSEYIADVLRARGYNAKVGKMDRDGLNLVLFPISPFSDGYQRGEGIYSRSLLEIGDGFEAHCNYRGALVDKGEGLVKTQLLEVPGAGNFSSQTGIKKNINAFSEFSASEKVLLKNAEREQMAASAEFIVDELGL